MKNGSVTQNDVAKEAGVTRSMVSYVINGNSDRSVAPETRQKIIDAIQKLGYRPNKAAQALLQGDVKFASNRIGIILCNADVFIRPYYADILSGIHTQAYKNNYHVSFIRFFDELKDPILFNNLIHKEEVGGLILVSLDQCIKTPEDIELIQNIKSRIQNVVCIEWQHEGISSVTFDRQNACEMAANYLFDRGYKNIAYIGEMDDRITGVKTSFLSHSQNISQLKAKPAFNIEGGCWAATEFIKNNELPRAIVCGSDEVAVGVIHALNENCIRIPEQVAVISMDNIEISGYTNPPLTTMNVQKKLMGSKAVEMIVANSDKDDPEVLNITLPTTLIERKSC